MRLGRIDAVASEGQHDLDGLADDVLLGAGVDLVDQGEVEDEVIDRAVAGRGAIAHVDDLLDLRLGEGDLDVAVVALGDARGAVIHVVAAIVPGGEDFGGGT